MSGNIIFYNFYYIGILQASPAVFHSSLCQQDKIEKAEAAFPAAGLLESF